MAKKESHRKNTTVLVAGFFGFMAVLAVSGTLLFNTRKTNQVTNFAISTNASTLTRSEVLGANTEAGGYAVAVTRNVTVANDATIGLDKKRVILTTEVENKDVQTLQFSPLLQISLIDESGVAYPVTAQFLAANRIIGGPIDAGKKISVELDFVMPANKTPKIVRFVAVEGQKAQDIKL